MALEQQQNSLAQAFQRVHERCRIAAERHQRNPEDIRLLAVSKAKPAALIREAAALGQREFGENYLQEAVEKIDSLSDLPDLIWHFIGPLQSNKTRSVAERFDWVHSVDRLKIARRLSGQRPESLPDLNVCIQVNISEEPQKAGVAPSDVPELADQVAALPRLRLRGLMCLPAPSDSEDSQRRPFRALKALADQLQAQGHELDTLSMGMSADLEAAIAEGSTLLRVGSALFGARE
ncbi:YggS family pyridoxal phosphate-dependent enzyme [Gammaproteobacteria bacterium AB-CW1]|uniref:Pyridoxal phosphate homeostasis protein n=1 Tax=Natronospira elongata TaxID=3110268 RepID=A0AAP6MLH0_9GAMM|nr:YggS family pyridoxal phosphate-dependent enzyme [Gammaproteobacteria bacterium AB-CW1]